MPKKTYFQSAVIVPRVPHNEDISIA